MSFKLPRQNTKFRKEIKNKIFKSSILPISALIILISTVYYCGNKSYGLAFEHSGQTIETALHNGIYEKKATVTPISRQIYCLLPSELKSKTIEKTQSYTSEGFGIYADDKFIAASKDKKELEKILEEFLNQAKQQNPDLDIQFNEKICILEGVFLPEEIHSVDEIRTILNSGIKKITDYTVLENDTVVSIAQKFNITTDKLLELNQITESNPICVGDKLTIETFEKIIHTKSSKILTIEEEIPYSVETLNDKEKKKSYSKVLQHGKNGKKILKYKVEYIDGKEINRNKIEEMVHTAPIPKKIIIGTKENKLMWPVPYTRHISSHFGQRGKRFHGGTDISAQGIAGKPILASGDGKVVYIQRSNRSYGNHIIVEHSKGFETLYAHCAKINVSLNQQVHQGQQIATVGSTGDSTGYHLHFEVRVNNQRCNPLNYV